MIIRALFISIVMITAAAGAGALKPKYADPPPAPDLEALLPDNFTGWRRLDIAAAVLPPEAELGPGEAVAYRAWADPAGRVVTLVVAYGPPLGDSVRLHRPEACYRAQGHTITGRATGQLQTIVGAMPVIHLDTEKALRPEAVSYWLREGDVYVGNAAGHAFQFFRRGPMAADGALVRVSSKGAGEAAQRLHDRFLSDFVATLPPEGLALLTAAQS